jgi:hypothetical protein
MTTTGTYAWSPYLSDLIINAYGRCQIRRTALTTDHLRDAVMSANLMQSDWSNLVGVNAWTVELASTTLTTEVSVYDVDPSTTMIMAAYIESGDPARDRLIFGVGRDEYAAFPDKVTTGMPTVYWFDRLISPTITVWQPPDDNGPYILKYYRARQVQDASASGAVNPEVPYRFMEAYTSGLAVKLAEIYAPTELPRLQASAAASLERAMRRDTEDVPTYIVPALGAYTRGLS